MDVGPGYPGATREKKAVKTQVSRIWVPDKPQPSITPAFQSHAKPWCSPTALLTPTSGCPKHTAPFFPNPVGQLSPLPCRPLGNRPRRCCWEGEKCIPAIILKGYSCQTHCACGNTCWVAVAVGRARWRKTAVKVPAAVGSSAKTALCQLEMCQIIWLPFKYLGVHYICQLTLPGNTSALTPPLPRSPCSPTLISAFTFPCFFYSWFLLV